jgi:ABC-2 type transport system ATP-binding protein
MTAPPDDGVAIAVDSLYVDRGGRTVLDGVSLVVPRGRVVGLLGPSGSGKSTLMRSIVGVQIVRSGSIRVLGEPAGSPALRRRIGYATQASSVYGDLTVRGNLRYFAQLVSAAPGRVEATIDEVDLGGFGDHVVGRLSGGQLTRVRLAAALVGEPAVLVLDEPTVGLDPVLRRELWALFHRLAARGTTLLVSSHVMDEADRCDDLILMRDGRVIAAATPQELRERSGAADVEGAFLALVGEAVPA